jgi:oxygen-independent coproporphyrinogen-3 oxidase
MADGLLIGLYIHVPFCRAKCGYCDFDSFAGLDALFDAYTSALVQEIECAIPATVKTLYLGGGTPTVLPLSRLARILNAAYRHFRLDGQAEISIEANPSAVNREILGRLHAEGVNRLSLGVQSFNNDELQMLGRIHTASEAVLAFHSARQAGFVNLSLDLLYGLPSQTLASWQRSLQTALDLAPDHLSLYALTVEDGTPLEGAVSSGRLPMPNPDLAADMYEFAQDTLAAAGFVHYEISNWSRQPGLMCQHNLGYWRNEPYLGLGAGAHSWLGGKRWSNTRSPSDYVDQMLTGKRPVASEEEIHPELEIGETMMMGLRLLDEGVSFERFHDRFGSPLPTKFASQLQELAELGLIQTDDQKLLLSQRGRLLGNQVFRQFLPD